MVSARGRDNVTELARVRHALSSNFEVCGQIYLDEEKWLLSTSHFSPYLPKQLLSITLITRIRDWRERVR